MDYNQARQDAIRRKAALTARQKEIDSEIAQLHEERMRIDGETKGLDKLVETLDDIINGTVPEEEPLGFTDHIRKILRKSTVPLTPVQIRGSLKAVGLTGTSERNTLINVHTVLRRLKPYLEESLREDGKTSYHWKRDVPDTSDVVKGIASAKGGQTG